MHSDIKRQGFTLIEMSIVLVIIGLIIGGILLGRDLIKASASTNADSSAGSVLTELSTTAKRLAFSRPPTVMVPKERVARS